MISVSEAKNQILESLPAPKIETIKIEKSLGRILAEIIIADQDSPTFDNSSMDGIAVQSQDVEKANPTQPVELNLIGSIPAGAHPKTTLLPGQAIQIMTGALMPDGADSVVQVEHTNLDFSESITKDYVLVYHSSKPGSNIRKKGSFYSKDEILISPGQNIRPQDIAQLAMVNKPVVRVFRKPKVGLLTTGDELVPPGQPITPGKIRETNSYMLTALLEKSGADVVPTGIIPDSQEAIINAIQSLINSGVDLILTSGGVSMGAFDIVRKVLEEHGKLKLWRVNMRPGKPLAFGEYEGVTFIGLPGNPVSAFVGFHVFVKPAIEKMTTGKIFQNPTKTAKLLESVNSDGRETYLPAKLYQINGDWVVDPAINQSSGNLYALIPGNSLIILSIGVKFLNKGEFVSVLILD